MCYIHKTRTESTKEHSENQEEHLEIKNTAKGKTQWKDINIKLRKSV